MTDQPKKVTKLTDMNLSEVSLVAEPANRGARVLFFKSGDALMQVLNAKRRMDATITKHNAQNERTDAMFKSIEDAARQRARELIEKGEVALLGESVNKGDDESYDFYKDYKARSALPAGSDRLPAGVERVIEAVPLHSRAIVRGMARVAMYGDGFGQSTVMYELERGHPKVADAIKTTMEGRHVAKATDSPLVKKCKEAAASLLARGPEAFAATLAKANESPLVKKCKEHAEAIKRSAMIGG
jgi:hypothetical protein